MLVFKTALLILVGLLVVNMSLTLMCADRYTNFRDKVADFVMYTLLQLILVAPVLYLVFWLVELVVGLWS
jgi:prolipoprotein diacylglyceryltransferase